MGILTPFTFKCKQEGRSEVKEERRSSQRARGEGGEGGKGEVLLENWEKEVQSHQGSFEQTSAL